jgi:hypothetical protein
MSANVKTLPGAEKIRPISKWLRVNPAYGISMMDHLYNRLDGMYELKWAAQFKSEVNIQNWRESWAAQFEADGITPAQIEPGLVECGARYAWPPSVKEFVDAVKAAIKPAAHRDFPLMLPRHPTPTEKEKAAQFFAQARETLSRKKEIKKKAR